MAETALQKMPPKVIGDPLHIWILDDEASEVETLRDMLEPLKFKYSVARNPQEVLEQIDHGTRQIVLCDIDMPSMNWLAFLEQALQRDPDVYVILLNGRCLVETAIGAIKHGAYDYLPKPVDRARLKQILEDLAGQIQNPHGGHTRELADSLGNSWRPLPLNDLRQEHIMRMLELCQGNRVRTAHMLGIGRTSLYRYLKRDGQPSKGARPNAL